MFGSGSAPQGLLLLRRTAGPGLAVHGQPVKSFRSSPMAPHGSGNLSPPARPDSVQVSTLCNSRVVCSGHAFQNLAEPWMAEQSVQGSIHSVFWKACPEHAAPPKIDRAGEKHSHDGRNKQRDPGIPDRSEATASPDDPFSVLEQGNLPS